MKKFLAILSIMVFSLTAYAGQFDLKADSAYTAEQYEDAVALYQQAIDAEGTSSAIYYNLGNCYYRLSKPGKAIVAYERSLRLDPTNSNARKNLEFVNSKIIDRPGERGTFLSNVVDTIARCATPNMWACIAFALFLVIIISAELYFYNSNVAYRKFGFFGGIVALILFVLALFIALRSADIATSTDEAIITAPSTILSTSPRAPKDRHEEAMLLHEGTKVHILDSVTSRIDSVSVVWYDVEVDNEHRAWIRSTDVEKI